MACFVSWLKFSMLVSVKAIKLAFSVLSWCLFFVRRYLYKTDFWLIFAIKKPFFYIYLCIFYDQWRLEHKDVHFVFLGGIMWVLVGKKGKSCLEVLVQYR